MNMERVQMQYILKTFAHCPADRESSIETKF